MFLSVALVTGVGLHQVFNIWHADPVAGLVIAVFLLRESWRAIRQQELCCVSETQQHIGTIVGAGRSSSHER
jgi:Co/Zn/Cd efflux system component